ncbi:hypothetical protein PRIPAC_76572 [Pristionchus pacificus]|uniref:Uncharacterized protein n=1 Tax=Pristionchus pacificus TaxID=54126 RepID=A0A2A6BRP0_PRIPA|nr:hypothetical protein PRIPAC_76572 [Pristionchus pacificus]|eukprot:PDM68486.1 hypothetical protein PRIPAC_43988 [Pristionchus pacificus]
MLASRLLVLAAAALCAPSPAKFVLSTMEGEEGKWGGRFVLDLRSDQWTRYLKNGQTHTLRICGYDPVPNCGKWVDKTGKVCASGVLIKRHGNRVELELSNKSIIADSGEYQLGGKYSRLFVIVEVTKKKSG